MCYYSDMKRKISYPLPKLCFLAAFIALAIIFYFNNIPCITKTVTGIDCIGCGLTRAFISLLKLDIAAAFSYHPAFWTVPILFAELFFDIRLFGKPKVDLALVGVSVAALIITYIVRVIVPLIF